MEKIMAVSLGIVPAILIINVILSGAAKILAQVAAMTKSDKDDKALVVVNKIAVVLQKIVDLLSANIKH